ncbi:MAG: peptidylprolyl isomerase [Candidatus Omnitrophica bacterium]|nr:peptidylprolyl isomerase [Candidatus Omnitrophota bacterium]
MKLGKFSNGPKTRAPLFTIIALFAITTAVSYAAVVDKIMVVVNNEVITQGEIDRILAPAYEQYKSAFAGEDLIKKLDDARQAVLAQLIEEKLILSEAKRLNIEVDEKDVKAKVEEAKKRFPSNEMFEQALDAQRISLKELKAKFKEQLMSRKLVDQKVGSKIFITPNEVVEYYNSHTKDFSRPEEIRLSNILIKPKENVRVEKTVELVLEISKRLKAGSDFSELAKIYSEGPGAKDGGAMGYVRRGDLLPEIEKVVSGMKEGEVSEMIRTKIGYHFFKVDEKKTPEIVSLADARRPIEEVLWMGKMKEKSKEWIEDLRKYAYIAFK